MQICFFWQAGQCSEHCSQSACNSKIAIMSSLIARNVFETILQSILENRFPEIEHLPFTWTEQCFVWFGKPRRCFRHFANRPWQVDNIQLLVDSCKELYLRGFPNAMERNSFGHLPFKFTGEFTYSWVTFPRHYHKCFGWGFCRRNSSLFFLKIFSCERPLIFIFSLQTLHLSFGRPIKTFSGVFCICMKHAARYTRPSDDTWPHFVPPFEYLLRHQSFRSFILPFLPDWSIMYTTPDAWKWGSERLLPEVSRRLPLRGSLGLAFIHLFIY